MINLLKHFRKLLHGAANSHVVALQQKPDCANKTCCKNKKGTCQKQCSNDECSHVLELDEKDFSGMDFPIPHNGNFYLYDEFLLEEEKNVTFFYIFKLFFDENGQKKIKFLKNIFGERTEECYVDFYSEAIYFEDIDELSEIIHNDEIALTMTAVKLKKF